MVSGRPALSNWDLVVPVMVSILLNTNPPTQGTGSLVCILKPTLLGLIVKAAYVLP